MNPGAIAAARPGQDPALNGLRGLAMLWVLITHAEHFGVHLFPWVDLDGSGSYGVYLFFCLSAFLLTKLVLGAEPSLYGRPIFWANYLFRRFFRIYPLYTAILLLYMIQDRGSSDVHAINTLATVADHLLLVKGYEIFWTIPVEFRYYLVLPVVALVLIWCKPRPLLGAALLSAAIIGTHQLFPPALGSKLAPHLCIFLCGSLGAFAQWCIDEKRFQLTSSRRFRYAVELVGLVCFVRIVERIPVIHSIRMGVPVGRDAAQLEYLAFGIQWTLVILATINGVGILRRLFAGRIMDWLGKVSFSADTSYKTADLSDNLHPNDAGCTRMADAWYAKLGTLLR